MLRCAENHYRRAPLEAYARCSLRASHLVLAYLNLDRQRPASPILHPVLPYPRELAPGPAVQAWVNQGRWLVECPWCRSAQLAALTDPRMLCTTSECMCAPVDGAMLPVQLPELPELLRIEAALLLRPDPATRGWRAGESVADLLTQARAKGVSCEAADVARVLRRHSAQWLQLHGEAARPVLGELAGGCL